MNLSIWKILAIGGGGFFGALSRYIAATAIEAYVKHDQFPFGIAIVNIVGCFLIGLLAALFELKGWMNIELRMFIFVGFLGGFTTFSTFINDTFILGKEGEILSAMMNAGGQVIVGLLFVWCGYALAKLFA